jgi:hypothetical protein
MDWKEATGDDARLDLVREGRKKVEQGSESPSRRRWKIKESMLLNYESICVDSSYSPGNPMNLDLTGGDVDIYQTQLGKL